MSYSTLTPVASGTTFTQLLTFGFSGHLENLLSKQLVTSAPITALTMTSSGGGSFGGSLAPGGYYANFTETNAYGETTPSVESSQFSVITVSSPLTVVTASVGSATIGSLPAGGYYAYNTWIDSTTGGESTVGASQSAVFTCAAGNEPTLTIPARPAYASATNVYLTGANGTTGSETLYVSGVTTNTVSLANALWNNNTVAQSVAPAPPTSSGLSANIPLATKSAFMSNNYAWNLYITPVNGATGSEVLYLRGITANTTALSLAAPGSQYGGALPTVNTTAPDTAQIQFIRSGEMGRLDQIYRRARAVVYEFLHGTPMNQTDMLTKFREAHAAVATLNTTFQEIGVLLDANPGHVVNIQTGIGSSGQKRIWP